ncbi:hypothetical protein [uncultured Limosilactobacillus sp.]|uniref:hypothetical protein n=1 Tax=uncultured Limosilactobacillus sp. TaxID=2837629 RepID=UPI0025D3BE6E|nr:hypothetical protein [uncultured Limosilactobacillus sp.]
MTKLMVRGHQPLSGEVELSGDQQTIMAIQAASLLSTHGTVIIDNVPATANVVAMNRFLQSLNVVIEFDRHRQVLKMDTTRHIESVKISGQEMLAAGSILARTGQVQLVDNGLNSEYRKNMIRIGELFARMGANIKTTPEMVNITADHLVGKKIDLQGDTLTTTLTIMMAATMAQGITVLNHPYSSPAVIELARILNKMGARVHGAGTSTIRIQGVTFLHSTDYYALDDQEEASVYLIIGALTAGDILIHGARKVHLRQLITQLEQMGNTVIVQRNGIRIIGTKFQLPVDMSKHFFVHNGLYAQIALLALQMVTQGTTKIAGFSKRQLEILGCAVNDDQNQLNFQDNCLAIQGPFKHYPALVTANLPVTGLLALLNALVADQVTTINPAEVAGGSFVHLIDRLIELGAKMELNFE